MSARRSLADRVLRRVAPVPVARFAPPPRPVADAVWVVDRRLALPPGLLLPTRMTVLGLPGDRLVLHSPVWLDRALRAALAALGEVAAIVAPNGFHYIYAADAAAAFPAARLWAAPGLGDRVPAFAAASVLGTDAPPLCAGVLEHAVFGPVAGNAEIALCHRPSGTLVLTDLAFNMRHIAGTYQRLAWRVFGVPPRFAPSRTVRLTLLRDRTRVRPFVERVLRWEFARVIVAHGDVLERDARAEFARAFAPYLQA